MMKSDLLALIAHLPDDADIRIHQPSRDYWCGAVAADPTRLEEARVSYSAYHQDDVVDDSGEEEHTTQVYMLR